MSVARKGGKVFMYPRMVCYMRYVVEDRDLRVLGYSSVQKGSS